MTTPIIEYPPKGGPLISVDSCIKALSKISELYIIARIPQNQIGAIETEVFYSKFCNDYLYVPSNNNLSSNRYLRKFQKIARDFLSIDSNFIINYFDEKDIDILWCDRGISTSASLIKKIKKKRPDIPIVCDTEAVQSKFILREIPFQKSYFKKIKIYLKGKKAQRNEKQIFNLSNVITAVSEIDASYYRKTFNYQAKVKIYSNVVDTNNYSKESAPNNLFHPSILLAGTFYGNNSPMEEGTRWFISNVLPLVKKEIPEIHLYIIGRNSSKILNDIKDKSITVLGEVDSVVPYLSNVDVVIVPIRFESGTRFKILEAGAAGRPVVSTTLGAEGLSVTNGKDIFIADDQISFSLSIIKVLNNTKISYNLGNNLKQLIIENYSLDKLEKEGQNIVKYIMDNKK
ncbi:MAG: glycosyltransferase [Bacteroidetes bacterium]|nr:glycosyltransferase [Bacteroidota bacterium]